MNIEDEYARIGEALAASVPPDWKEAWVTAEVFDDSTDATYDYINTEGQENWFTPESIYIADIGHYLRVIRKNMIKAGQAPWTKCTFRILADGNFSFDIEYPD